MASDNGLNLEHEAHVLEQKVAGLHLQDEAQDADKHQDLPSEGFQLDNQSEQCEESELAGVGMKGKNFSDEQLQIAREKVDKTLNLAAYVTSTADHKCIQEPWNKESEMILPTAVGHEDAEAAENHDLSQSAHTSSGETGKAFKKAIGDEESINLPMAKSINEKARNDENINDANEVDVAKRAMEKFAEDEASMVTTVDHRSIPGPEGSEKNVELPTAVVHEKADVLQDAQPASGNQGILQSVASKIKAVIGGLTSLTGSKSSKNKEPKSDSA